MKTNRRDFLSSAALMGAGSTLIPLSSCSSDRPSKSSVTDYTELDRVMAQPVLKRELFPSPVIIEKLELLQDRKNFICRVRSKEGAEGISIGHPFIAHFGYPMFLHALHHLFVGKDARDLDTLIFQAVEGNIKRQGIPLCVQIATIEFAILDMLGTMVDQPVGKLIGEVHHPEISIYLGTRYTELRKLKPEESLELVYQDYLKTRAKAIKIRAGRGDNLGSDIDNAPGRTEKLIKMAREKFGDDMVLMIDGNGSYSVEEAIRMGRILEEYNYYFYEEPVPWDWYEEQKLVAEGLSIPIESKTEPFSSAEKIVTVPTGSGLGIRIDPDYIRSHGVLFG